MRPVPPTRAPTAPMTAPFRRLLVAATSANLGDAGYFAVLVLFVVGPGSPLGLSEVGYGLLAAVLAAGSVAGSLVAGRLEERFGPRGTALGGVALTSATMLVPVVTTSVVAVAVQLSALVAFQRPISDTALRGELVS